MRVAILGCGPAGLLAAHAAKERDCEIEIFSKKEMSPIGGAQYIHEAIPGITEEDPDALVSFARVGFAGGYAHKLYGDKDAPTSWESFSTGEFPAWSMQMAYQRLWKQFEPLIKDQPVDSSDVYALSYEFDLVFSSIPRPSLCNVGHHAFRSQPIVLTQGSLIKARNVVLYSGRPEDAWYRTSDLFGFGWTEFSEHKAPEPLLRLTAQDRIYKGFKPLEHNCDCLRDLENVHHIGRFGKFEKGVLVSHAYRDTQTRIMNWMEPMTGDEVDSLLLGDPDVSGSAGL
jgi:hypothetical protein